TAVLPEDREPTPVEASLCDFLVEHLLLPAAQETWLGPEAIDIRFGQRETNLRYSRVFAPSASLAVSSFALRGPFGEQACCWLVPQKLMLHLLADDQEQVEEPAGKPADRAEIEHLVRGLPVPISVTLGSADVPLS